MGAAVSVIMPTFNGLRLLQRVVESLERQDFPDFETVVIDDGSTDGTADWLNNYSGRLNLKSVLLPENSGRSLARNRGVEAARGELLILLDADMVLPPDFLRGHVESHCEDSVAVIGRVVFDHRLGRRGLAKYLEGRGGMRCEPGEPLPGRFFLSGNASLTRRMFELVGGFDESLRSYGEDIDFGLRLVKAGFRIIQNPALVSIHQHLRSLGETLRLARQIGVKSYPELVARHPALLSEFKLDLALRQDALGALIRLLLSEPVYQPLRVLGEALSEVWAPRLLVKYLLYRNFVKGFRSVQLNGL